MSEESWGIKRVCLACGTRFYDFDKFPINCPNCAAVFDPEYLSKRKIKVSVEKNEDIDVGKIDLAEDVIAGEPEDEISALEEDSEADLSIDDAKI